MRSKITMMVGVLALAACSHANPLVGDWEGDRTGNRMRIQQAADGSLEALLVRRDDEQSFASATRSMSAEDRATWTSPAARDCILRIYQTDTVTYRAFHEVGDGAWEAESRSRTPHYSTWTGCDVAETWVRRRLALTPNGDLEVRPLDGGDALSTWRRVPSAEGASH